MLRNTLLLAALGMLSAPAVARADTKDDIAKFTRNLTSNDVDLRREAAKGLADLGSKAKSAAPQLLKALGDKDLFVRRFSAQALAKTGADPKTAIPALTKLMSDEDKEVIEAAVTALAAMGPPAVPALTDGLKSKSAQVRILSARGLGKIGQPAKSSVSALVDAFTATPEKAKGEDRKKVDEDRVLLRKSIAETLGNIGPDAKSALPVLKEAADEKTRDREFKNLVNAAIKKIEASGNK